MLQYSYPLRMDLKFTATRPSLGEPPEPDQSRPGVLTLLLICVLLASLGTSTVAVALPDLARDLHASQSQAQWVILAYLLAITTVSLAAGRAGDLLGRRPLLLSAIGLFTATSLAAALTKTIGILVAIRFFQGAAAAAMLVLATALITATTPKSKSGTVMGLLGTASALGTAAGPAFGGFLSSTFGWSAIFWVNAPLGLATWLFLYRQLPSFSVLSPLPVDPAGITLVMLALGGLTLGLMGLGHGLDLGHLGLGCASLLLLVVFLKRDQKLASPLIPSWLLKESTVFPGLLASLAVSIVMITTLVLGPFFLAQGLGLRLQTVGMVMSIGPILAAAAAMPSGRNVDRFGAEPMVLLGLGLMVVGCLVFALAAQLRELSAYLTGTIIVTLGYAQFQTANNSALLNSADASHRGLVAGLLNLSRNFGFVLGVSLFGSLFARLSNAASGILETQTSIQTAWSLTFLLAALLPASAAFLSLKRREKSAPLSLMRNGHL